MQFHKPIPHALSKMLRARTDRRQVEAVKRQVRARDRFTCRCCNRKDQLDTHEHKRRGAGGEVSLVNSFTACRTCHSLIQSRHIDVTWPGMEDARVTFDANGPLRFMVPKAIADVLFPKYLPAQVTVIDEDAEDPIDESLGQV